MSFIVHTVPHALIVLAEMPLDDQPSAMQASPRPDGSCHYWLRIKGWAIDIRVRATPEQSDQMNVAIETNRNTLGPFVVKAKAAGEALAEAEHNANAVLRAKRAEAKTAFDFAKVTDYHGAMKDRMAADDRAQRELDDQLRPYVERLEAASHQAWPGVYANGGSWTSYIESLKARGVTNSTAAPDIEP